MTRPTQETVDTFTSITGASQSVALQKLEEYGGNLNEAVNAYFSEGHRDILNPTAVAYPYPSPGLSSLDMNSNNIQARPSRLSQLFSAARSFRPSSLLDPNYRRSLLNELSASLTSPQPVASHTGGVLGLPAEFSSWNEQPYHSGQMPYDYDGARTSSYHGRDTRDNLLRDNGSHFYGNDIEEQMIQAAIEASKQEASSGSGVVQRELELPEDDEFSRAISLSLKTAEQEKTIRGQGVKDRDRKLEVYDLVKEAEKTNNSTRKPGKSSVQEGAENMRSQSPMRYKSEHDVNVHTQCSKDAFPANEWGGISSKELDEAVMLEAALFGEAATGCSKYVQSDLDSNAGPGSSSGSRASSSVMAQQSLREQQDDEYLASLLADREKEMNALKEAESLQLSRDESQKKILEEEVVKLLSFGCLIYSPCSFVLKTTFLCYLKTLTV
ncbi:Plant UBX domain-containing protein 8 [Citrus sinensis]|nr:Plant UBX domain-containing protein 8 [Citrus sinensis]